MKSKKGFTLIELIVVLAILAVIAAIAVPTAFGSIEKANVAADKASIDGLNSAIRMSAVIEKGDTVLMGKKATEAVKAGATTIQKACEDAQISATTGMLSKGAVAFTPAKTGTIASFVYVPVEAGKPGTPPAGATVVAASQTAGATWSAIYGDAAVKDLTCNFFTT